MFPKVSRNVVIVASVLLFHGAALWLLQTGLLRRAVEVLVPVQLLSEFIEPPKPKEAPPPPPVLPKAVTPPAIAKATTLPPPPIPLAIADPTPAPNAPVGVVAPPKALPPITAPVATNPAPVAAVKVELPSSDADYLQNPKPAYPAMSKRLGEQGKVVVRVLIGVDGTAQKAEIRQSSGFDRLDQAALSTTQRWRYVPGKRGGVAEAMWFNVPINFVLE
ncbi:MAG: TonB family protein [Rhodoferax sp.]|uniref:energy transducer TonB n=1 Tax=Rhodoferax sp. TaxID=50421 RepID=UPI0030194231